MSTPVPWLRSFPALVLVFVLSAFLIEPSAPVAAAFVDPAAGTLAQDEALYAHSILRIANGETPLTPQFLGRLSLVKPPLFHWLSAASLRLFGPHLWALRLPGILAAAGVLTLLYATLGPVGWLLCFSQYLWRARAGLAMMDDLLTLLYLLAVLWIAKDRKLEGRGSAWVFGALVGLAVMTKWFAGVLPLAMLFWGRPPWRRWVEVAVATAVVALPWHAYQFFANREWFLAEYLGVELLSYAVAAPVQSTQESHWHFYAVRAQTLWPLFVPLLLRRWSPVWLVWCGVLSLAIAAYSYQNASYLVPLVPAILLCSRGWLPLWLAPLALVGWLGNGPASPGLRPIGSDLAEREVLHLDADDQLRTALSPDATLRYVFLLEHLPPNGPLDFEQRGIAKSTERFLADPGAQVDAVLVKDLDALRLLIAGSPQRDFLLPPKAWAALAMSVPHEVIVETTKIRLKSRHPVAGPRPNRFQLLDGPGFAK
ncbi:ArnT family glycosyltransferase [Bryobacter aggregatus]|uniref:ArnT family glycosyltransferase n=1 Tax=Bryobacter aggregatus TaxID=360054 RepID=UPI0004E0BFA1|nr:glycosyltransferase family 39 protein [Bryobacter aggregatus]